MDHVYEHMPMDGPHGQSDALESASCVYYYYHYYYSCGKELEGLSGWINCTYIHHLESVFTCFCVLVRASAQLASFDIKFQTPSSAVWSLICISTSDQMRNSSHRFCRFGVILSLVVFHPASSKASLSISVVLKFDFSTSFQESYRSFYIFIPDCTPYCLSNLVPLTPLIPFPN